MEYVDYEYKEIYRFKTRPSSRWNYVAVSNEEEFMLYLNSEYNYDERKYSAIYDWEYFDTIDVLIFSI